MPRTTLPLISRFWPKVAKASGCWLWKAAIRRDGYGLFTNQGRHYAAHRLSWELTHGPIPDGMWVLHHCDVRACVRPDHLYLGTREQNTSDAMLRHRFKSGDEAHFRAHPEIVPRGERHWASRLTDDDVRDIRRRVAAGEKQVSLQREYELSSGLVSLIVHRKRWAHVTD